EFARDRVPRTQDVEPLTPRGSTHEDPLERPEAAQERAEHKMGRVDKEHMTVAGLSSIQSGLQLVVVESGLGFDVLGQVFLGGTGIGRTRRNFSPMSLRNLRTWLGPRRS